LNLIDLHHLGLDQVIGCYLLETPDGPALFDCGPASALPRLKEGLAANGLEVGDLRHLLLSHIHLDHAGAAGVLVRENPGLRVHVSEIGAPHLVDPSRLERSARRLYGDDFDRLWGELAPVPEENVVVAGPRVLDFDCFPSPGHASHHVCYVRDGVLYAGDAAGVRIQPGRFVLLPTPPPDIDLEAWQRTLDEIERRAPEQIALIHFGVADDPGRHLEELRARIERWGGLVGDGADEADWTASVVAEIRASGEDRIEEFDVAMPLTQSYAGLRRYWDKKAEAAA
jgi:glyoxylase-like metal-dependent hydrolase (beta-lactamase superfamily II)